MKKQYIQYLLLLLVIPFLGCKKSSSTAENQGPLFVSFAVSDELMIDREQTKAATMPAIADFTITVTAEGAATPLHTFTYDQRPEKLKLESGTYTFTCSYGDATLTHSATPVFSTSQTLALTGRPEPYPITFKPERTHLCLDVKYSPGFDTYYENYSIEVASAALSESVTFGANGKDITHYFKRGAAYTATFHATKKSNSATVTSPLAAISADTPQNYHLLTLTFGGPSFDSQIKEYRVVKSLGYIYNSTQLNGSTQSQITSIAPLKQVTYNLDGAEVTPADQGITATAGDYNQAISYDQLIARLLPSSNADGNKVLTITAIDQNDKSATQTINITVEEPQFTISTLTAGNMWNKSADFVVAYSPNYNGLFDAPKVQYSRQGGEWTDANIAKDAGEQATTVCNRITGLQSGTQYAFRAVMGDYDKTTNAFNTETPDQVPNAGFEEWNLWYFKNGSNAAGYGSGIPYYDPWQSGSGEWWNTSNCRSVRYTVFKDQWNNLPGVMWTTSAKVGARAAEIRSVHVSAGAGQWSVCGKLLIGSLTSNGPSSGYGGPEYITEGRPFAARPTKVRLWYKYDVYGSDNYVITVRMRNGDNVIAEKEVTGNSTVGDYTQMDIELPYSNITSKVTSIYICFASSSNDGFSYRDLGVVYPDCWGSGWKGKIGSILNIDNVELIYEK